MHTHKLPRDLGHSGLWQNTQNVPYNREYDKTHLLRSGQGWRTIVWLLSLFWDFNECKRNPLHGSWLDCKLESSGKLSSTQNEHGVREENPSTGSATDVLVTVPHPRSTASDPSHLHLTSGCYTLGTDTVMHWTTITSCVSAVVGVLADPLPIQLLVNVLGKVMDDGPSTCAGDWDTVTGFGLAQPQLLHASGDWTSEWKISFSVTLPLNKQQQILKTTTTKKRLPFDSTIPLQGNYVEMRCLDHFHIDVHTSSYTTHVKCKV